MKRYLIIGIFFLASLLRLIGLSDYPAGFSADEVSQGYTAYSILLTGKDEWGEILPIAPRSFGDYRAPLLTYLTIPSVAIFGLNEFAVRLPNALLGSLTVVVVYFLVKEFRRLGLLNRLGNKKLEIGKWKLEILAASLLAVSPWHIMLSRGAFEPNLPSFIIPFGVLAFLKGKDSKKWMTISMLTFGLGLFSYYSARFLIPIILAVLIYLFYKKTNFRSIFDFGLSNKLPIFVFLIFLSTAIYTMFFGAGSRSSDVAIFNPTDDWSALSDQRFEAVVLGLPDFVSRIFSNKLTYSIDTFMSSYLSYFSPQFLFTSGAGEATYGMLPGQGLLYLVELFFLATALCFVIKDRLHKTNFLKFVLLMLLIAPVPAALAKGPGFAANRAAVMVPWIQILSALGGSYLFRSLNSYYKPVLVKIAFFGIFTISVVGFLEKYIYHAPIQNSRFMSYGFTDAFEYISENEDKYNQIIISREFSEPQIFTAFYMKTDPRIVQEESIDWLRYEEEGFKFVDMLSEYRLDKFVYKSIDYSEVLKRDGILIVDQAGSLPENVSPTVTVYYPDFKPAIYLIETGQRAYADKSI